MQLPIAQPPRLDLVIAAAVAIGLVADAAMGAFGGGTWILLGLAVPGVVSLALRRQFPVTGLAVWIAIFVTAERIDTSGQDSFAAPIAGLIMLYGAGVYALRGRQLVAAAVLIVVAAEYFGFHDGGDVSSFVFYLFMLGIPWGAGAGIGRYRRRTALAEAEVERARQAVEEERQRIARELHDVVAHALSVIVLQARGARRVMSTDSEQARHALDSIERASGEALVDMRRLLGLLRADDEQLALAPQPSLRELPRLVERVRGAGLPVELVVEGAPVELPPGIDLSAYRIVQEALTNALKHAGPARARVTVRYADDEVELEVADEGSRNGPGEGTGRGLAGMRERVAVFGGDLHSGPRPEGGYVLRARLPLGSERG